MLLNRRVRAVAGKEIKEIYRDRLYLAMAMVVPVMVLILFGYGLALDVKDIPFGVLDQNRSSWSREYVDRLGRSGYFSLRRYFLRPGAMDEELVRGGIRLGLIIPPDFERRLGLGQESEVQALIDGSFPDRAETSRSYLEAVTEAYNLELARRGQGVAGRGIPWIAVQTRAWFNADLESKNFIVPGMMVTILFFFPVLLSSITIVREKESGSIFNIYCSPLRRWEYVLGKLLPYLGLGLVNYVMVYLLSYYLFRVPFRGSFVLLTVAALLYVGVSTAWGLLLSVLLRTQVAAMLLGMVSSVIPAFLYSGFFIAVNSMGTSGRIMAALLPPTYFMEMVRGIYLKGLGVRVYWSNLLVLLLFFICLMALSVSLLRKRVG